MNYTPQQLKDMAQWLGNYVYMERNYNKGADPHTLMMLGKIKQVLRDAVTEKEAH